MKTTLITIFMIIVTISKSFCQEPCLQNAWDAYNKGNWNLAIKNAEDCTFSFGPKARQFQKDLQSKGYFLPANYDTPYGVSPQQRDEIFGHGLLNDVVTSYWIIGMSNLRLKNSKEAKDAFIKASELNFGLCFDPIKKLFWSPSEDADLRLKE